MSASESRPGVVDCDLWIQRATFETLGPYLDPSWRSWLRLADGKNDAQLTLPESRYFLYGSALSGGDDDPIGAVDAYLRRDEIVRAVLNPGVASGLAGLGSALLATEVARASNAWTAAWLERDERLLGSIIVALRDPRAAAEEIRAAAENDRMAQVVVAYPPALMGSRALTPVYEAATECGLPVVLQAGGDYAGRSGGLTAVGNPASHYEAFVSWEYGAQAHLVSLVAGGVFDRFPQLLVVFNGFGVAWLPSVLWRLDLEAHAGRVAPPALSRLPSEYLRDHVRFTTAQLELTPGRDDLESLVAAIGAEELLLYASGPLRGDGESDLTRLGSLPEAWREIVRVNAAQLYALRSRSPRSG